MAIPYDAHANFAYSTVATAPSPASSGTSLVVAAGTGTIFPATPFNASVWPAGSNPLTTTAEIVRVTNISTDTFTISRTQESTSARTILVGDQIAASVTAKTATDIENSINGYRNESSGTTTPALLITDVWVEVTNNSTTGVAAPSGVAAGFKILLTNSTTADFVTGIAYVPSGLAWLVGYNGSAWKFLQSTG